MNRGRWWWFGSGVMLALGFTMWGITRWLAVVLLVVAIMWFVIGEGKAAKPFDARLSMRDHVDLLRGRWYRVLDEINAGTHQNFVLLNALATAFREAQETERRTAM